MGHTSLQCTILLYDNCCSKVRELNCIYSRVYAHLMMVMCLAHVPPPLHSPCLCPATLPLVSRSPALVSPGSTSIITTLMCWQATSNVHHLLRTAQALILSLRPASTTTSHALPLCILDRSAACP